MSGPRRDLLSALGAPGAYILAGGSRALLVAGGRRVAVPLGAVLALEEAGLIVEVAPGPARRLEAGGGRR